MSDDSSFAEIATKNLQVLILDDDTIALKFVENTLRKLDVTNLLTAGNGKQGLAILAQHSPDLLLCDLGMPEMDGIEFLQQLSKQKYGGGVILISGFHAGMLSGMEVLGKKLDLNILGSLTKPILRDHLAAMIKRFCQSRQSPQNK